METNPIVEIAETATTKLTDDCLADILYISERIC